MKKILIIEDDLYLRDMYKDKFTGDEFTVLEANDGVDGLAKALYEKPDIILLDIAMPRMDGITMLKKLRTDPWGTQAKVIVLTNVNIDGDMLNTIVQSHPAYCMMKAGVTPREVYEKVQELTPSK